MRQKTEQEAYLALAALCAQAEHCQWEMTEKMRRWELGKVEQALWQKHIGDDIRQRVLDEVDDAEYLGVLRPLLKQKRRSTKAQDDYELNRKLTRFALSRGFTFDIIRQCIDVGDEDQYGDNEEG